MAREINSRLRIKGFFEAVTPIHIGGYGDSFETDMALAKNGRDEFYVPGTSLTGTMREWFRQAYGHEKLEMTFGNEAAEFASFVLIEDMPIIGDVTCELRDGVGVDRYFGTGAEGVKFDRTVLPRGTKFNLDMTVEIGNEHDPIEIKCQFGHLIEAIQKGGIRLGASKTRGLGKIKGRDIQVKEEQLLGPSILDRLRTSGASTDNVGAGYQNLDTFKGTLEKVLADDGTETDYYKRLAPNPPEQLNINISWKPKSPLMVKAGYDGIGVDTLPLVSANGTETVSLCLPGSSIKGAFRSHAERIIRTFLGETSEGKDFHDQIDLTLIEELFGSKKKLPKENAPKPEKQNRTRLGLGALSIDDCYANLKMDSDDWGKVESGEFPKDTTYSGTGLHNALKKIDCETNEQPTRNFQISHHTSVDRFTGAASDGALFSVLSPTPKLTWEDLALTLDLNRFTSDDHKYSGIMLLLLVLRDFADNRIPLGFGTNRGMGEIDRNEIEMTISGAGFSIHWKKGAKGFEFEAGDKKRLEQEWTQLISKLKREV